jgi:DNA-directed RNA polymerase delta subunit
LVSKKTGLALSDTNRDEVSGTAKGESKGGTTTGIENEMLVGVDADEIISEFCGVRGDNAVEYDNMISKISETGSVKLADIKTSIFDKPTLLKADMYFIAMGLKTDLVSESYYSVDKIRKAMNQNH